MAPETLLMTPSGIAEMIMNGMQISRFFVNQPTSSVITLAPKPPRHETIISVRYSNFLNSFGKKIMAPNIPTAAQIWMII